MPRLDFFLKEEMVVRVALSREVVNIGRHKWCEVQLPDPKVSRFHAKILCDEDGDFWVENQSTYGTRLNAAQLEKKEKLRAGDLLYIGSYVVAYYPEDAPPLDEEYMQTIQPD